MVAVTMRAALSQLRPVWPVLIPLALAACGGGGHRLASSGGYGHSYIAPGPPEDPWRPYIVEASDRFSVPKGWIRAVIRQESGGHEYLNGRPVTSDAGAMGLMQLMPATYAELRDRYNLGNDPYDPHDNIMAGTGYISELYARYGSPAFLVAYNAGPRRLEDYNAGRGALPNETIAYLASVAPALAEEGPVTGPLAAYADARGTRHAPVQVYAASTRSLGGCWRDPDAAYDPDDPCNRHTAPASAPVLVAAAPAPVARQTAPGTVLWGASGNAVERPHGPPPPSAVYIPPSYASAVSQTAAPAATSVPSYTDAAPHGDANAQLASAPYAAGAPLRGAVPTYTYHGVASSGGDTRPPSDSLDASFAANTSGAGTMPTYTYSHTPSAYAEARPVSSSFGSVAERAAVPSYTYGNAPRSYADNTSRRSRFALISSAQAEPVHPNSADARWGIQVGAFTDAGEARAAAEAARHAAPAQLASARPRLGRTIPFGGQVLYRARLIGVTHADAENACGRLASHRWSCVTVPPGG